jgi:hypothetical protein
MQITTYRFFLRPLTKAEVTERYLGRVSNPLTSRFIETASDISGPHDLENYVAEHNLIE